MFLAFEDITAARLNRLQPKSYWAQASGTVAAGSTGVDVPSCSVTFTTETVGATVAIDWTAAFYSQTSAATGLSSVFAVLDATNAPTFAIAQMASSTDRVQGAANWQTTIATPGSHTIKLKASTNVNVTLQVYTSLKFVVTEVV